MKRIDSAALIYNQFINNVNGRKLFGFFSKGASVLTTNQELASKLLCSADSLSCRYRDFEPTDISELGFSAGCELSDVPQNIIHISSPDQTALIINNLDGIELLLHSSIDTLIAHHIESNNIDPSQDNKLAPQMTVTMSQQNAPSLTKKFNLSHQFNEDVLDFFAYILVLAGQNLSTPEELELQQIEKMP